MKNFSVKIDNKEYWISRSVAVCVFIYKQIGNTIYSLVEQRGNGAADNQHAYCSVCGYLDFDETARECGARESIEEVGFECDKTKMKLVSVNTAPRQNRQNISLHYIYFAGVNERYDLNKRTGGEINEIENVEWLPIANVYNNKIEIIEDNFINKKWAFNHDKLIKIYITKYYGKEKEIEENILHI